MKKLLLGLFGLFSISVGYAQNVFDVTEQTIKIGNSDEETLYYGFAAGDKIVFDFQELNGKELKEIEILEYPNNSKFSDYKTAKIENKTINVIKQGIYVFRFKNSALSGRICKIKIQRIPINETSYNFDTSVRWITKQDTTWKSHTKNVVIGYDTSYVQLPKRELVKVDTTFVPIFDKVMRVNANLSGKSQYTYATVELPVNSYYPNEYLPSKSTEVISWSYWIGVGQKSLEEYDRANKNISSSIMTLGNLTGYGVLATLLVTGRNLIGNVNAGDNVVYKFYGIQNNQKIVIDSGNVIAASGKNEKVKQGSFSIELYNDNVVDVIDVNIKIIAMQITKTWDNISYREQIITPKTEKQTSNEPIITTQKIPVMSDL